jgi:hypothetical protein
MNEKSSEIFKTAALERHRSFVDAEALAKDDEEKVRLFMHFVVKESQALRCRFRVATRCACNDPE